MTDIRLMPVPSTMLADAWPEIGPFFESIAANSGGKFAASDLARLAANREVQTWAAVKNGAPIAVGLTELANYPRQRVCRFVSVNGRDHREWIANISSVERWAAIEGAARMEILAPRPWQRWLTPYGYCETHVMLEKKIGA